MSLKDQAARLGLIKSLRIIDTVGFFTRTIQLAVTAAKTLTFPDREKNACSASVELLYPTDIWAGRDAEYRSWVEPFLRKFESFLKVKRREIDINDMFRKHSGACLHDYLNTARTQP